MRISDWSSDVCSSDLHHLGSGLNLVLRKLHRSHDLLDDRGEHLDNLALSFGAFLSNIYAHYFFLASAAARKIGRASCRERVCQYGVDLGGRRLVNKKNI